MPMIFYEEMSSLVLLVEVQERIEWNEIRADINLDKDNQ
jgi:hypothetical protein